MSLELPPFDPWPRAHESYSFERCAYAGCDEPRCIRKYKLLHPAGFYETIDWPRRFCQGHALEKDIAVHNAVLAGDIAPVFDIRTGVRIA